MAKVRPHKKLAQHFLRDEGVLLDIVDVLKANNNAPHLLEIGPGTGALTQYLWPTYKPKMSLIELDSRCVHFLREKFPDIGPHIIHDDFLQLDLDQFLTQETAVIGNFPYNISSQIIFKVLEVHDRVPLVVGMFQKELAMRLASPPGSRVYGAISVQAQLMYEIEVAFDIGPEKFDPPPKVVSSVLVMRRRNQQFDVDLQLFRKVVKSGFSMRRKKLRNALSSLTDRPVPEKFTDRRAESLSVEEFIELSEWLGGS